VDLPSGIERALGRPAALEEAAEAFGPTRAAQNREIARMAGVTVRTVQRWRSTGAERRTPSANTMRRIRISAAQREARERGRRPKRARRGAVRQRGARIGVRGQVTVNGYQRRNRTVHFEQPISPETMTEVTDLLEDGRRDEAAETLQEAIAEAHGFDSLTLDDLEWLDLTEAEPWWGEEE